MGTRTSMARLAAPTVALMALLGLGLALGLGVGAGAAAVPAAEPSFTLADARGDVRIVPGDGPPRAQRSSIDLYRMSSSARPGGVLLTVRIAAVLRGDDLDQVVLVRARAARKDAPALEVGLSPQQPDLGYATLERRGEKFASCPVTTRVDRPARTVATLVPYRCVPSGRLRLSVTSSTGYFRTDAPTFSRDTLTSAKPRALR